jgi:hypothetical protein
MIAGSTFLRTGGRRGGRLPEPDPEYIVPQRTKRSNGIAGKIFIRKKSHRQAIAAGYTFSDCNISLAYCRHAAMSSCVIPG